MLKLANYARREGKRGDRDYFRWVVFVDEPPSVLNEIESVDYSLHPTFPEPRQHRTNAKERFAVETAGWGEFTIVADVKYRDGRRERIPYALDLHKQWPAGAFS